MDIQWSQSNVWMLLRLAECVKTITIYMYVLVCCRAWHQALRTAVYFGWILRRVETIRSIFSIPIVLVYNYHPYVQSCQIVFPSKGTLGSIYFV